MAAAGDFDTGSGDAHAPLLDDFVDGSIDHKGQPVRRSSSGGWRSAGFIIGVEVAERFAYYGISSNLINYLTGPLGQSVAAAAANVNAWSGMASLSPLLGAFIADSFLGRYRTIVIASVIYIMALGLLTFSAVIPSLTPTGCQSVDVKSCPPPPYQVVMFFSSLYLVAIAQGGHKPCVQAFGADQFDEKNYQERKAKSSFFNWWYFCMAAGTLVTLSVLDYIQDNFSWALGFGLPCISMVAALLLFLLGTKTYRFSVSIDEKSPFMRISTVFIAAFRNRKTSFSAIAAEQESCGTLPYEGSEQFKFLNKAMLAPDGSKEDGKVCTFTEIEEAKTVLRLIPIWATCLVYAMVFQQPITFFTKQGVTMDRQITPSFLLPSASLQSFVSVGIIICVPVYDRIFVPIARSITKKPSGVTMLQRIGIGMVLSIICMVLAASIEIQRLKIAREHGLIDKPNVPVPLSVWWLVPQYMLVGISDVFTMVGLQEFFYDQVPTECRSIGLALYLSIFGVGSFLSSFLVSGIEKATSRGGRESWFANNLNHAHLDYFYWVLAGLSSLELILFVYFSRAYVYNRRSSS